MANDPVYYQSSRSNVECGDFRHFFSLWMASLILAGVAMGRAAPLVLTVSVAEGIAGRCAAPISAAVDLSGFSNAPTASSQFLLTTLNAAGPDRAAPVAAQFEPDASDSRRGTLVWLMPPGPAGRRKFTLAVEATPLTPLMRVRRDKVSGQFEISEAGKPVLRYNYQTNEPERLLAKVTPDNLDRKSTRLNSSHLGISYA